MTILTCRPGEISLYFRQRNASPFLPETDPAMTTTITLPAFTPDQPAARVDAALREALTACDRARECAVLWFAEVQRRGLYRQLGHASLHLYATQALGFSDNRYWQFKRLADDLDRLPVLKDAVAAGELGWTKAQQVARVATPATQAAWVAKATAKGRRELEREVRAARRAPRNAAAPQLGLPNVPELAPAQVPLPATLTLRADSLQLARFEALVEKACKSGAVAAGADRLEVVLAALEALVEREAMAPAAPAFQVIVRECPTCHAAAAVTARGERPLAPAQVARVHCDAKVRTPGHPNRATIPPRVRAAVLARDRHRCATPGCGATRYLEVHHLTPRSQGGSNRPENLVTLCGRCHAFAHERDRAGLDHAGLDHAGLDHAGLAPVQVQPKSSQE
jgi:5-methylcytosine-specific restriction endonuclease McrA